MRFKIILRNKVFPYPLGNSRRGFSVSIKTHLIVLFMSQVPTSWLVLQAARHSGRTTLVVFPAKLSLSIHPQFVTNDVATLKFSVLEMFLASSNTAHAYTLTEEAPLP
jgi:hypothetical protein